MDADKINKWIEQAYSRANNDTPSYTELPKINALLIGVGHIDDPKSNDKKRNKFVQEIKKSEIVLMEHNLDIIQYYEKAGIDNYETLALKLKKEKTVLLEENSPFRELGLKYGIREDLYSFYDALPSLRILMGLGFRGKKLLGTRGAYFDATGFQETVENNRLEMQLGEIVPFLEKNQDYQSELAIIYELYFARVRDHDILAPKILDISKKVKGRKVIVVGDMHVPFLYKDINSECNFVLPTWPEFVKSDEKRKLMVSIIGEDFFPQNI